MTQLRSRIAAKRHHVKQAKNIALRKSQKKDGIENQKWMQALRLGRSYVQ